MAGFKSLCIIPFLINSIKPVSKSIKNFCFAYYKTNYDIELQKIAIDYQNELASKG